MYMYLLLSMAEFTQFCTYNDQDFCPIIHNSSIHCPARLVASRNTIYLGVLFLTVRMRDFPLSYEGVSQPAIEIMRHAYRMYYRTLQFILGRSDKFSILFSS